MSTASAFNGETGFAAAKENAPDVIILDLAETDALHILALAAAILALGLIYWLIGVRDRKGDEAA